MKYTPRNLCFSPPTAGELMSFEMAEDETIRLLNSITASLKLPTPAEQWRELSQSVLTAQLPFELHLWLFQSVFIDHSEAKCPPAFWYPDDATVGSANVTSLMNRTDARDFRDLHRWSVRHPSKYWQSVVQDLDIQFSQHPVQAAATAEEAHSKLPQCQLNIVESCFQANPNKTAIVCRSEDGSERSISYRRLLELVNQVANGLVEADYRTGDRIGMMLPMSIEAVAAYLGTIKAGCVPVSIAESFAAPEIKVRMKLADAKAIFLTDVIRRNGKTLPCFEKYVESGCDASAIVIPAKDESEEQIQGSFVFWSEFLSESIDFESVLSDHDGETNILFSSGTTGEPKAIPWTQTTPLKCAADARFHQNIHSNSVVAWPTSMGWMMGPWLIYASLLNKATMALFDGGPHCREFCTFVQDCKVTMLGVIPSLVRAWRDRDMLEGLDWTAIEVFSSTGECSSPDDMLFLSSKAGYRPIIEYCGGTEIGGGYVTSTVVQPNSLSCFSTPALGIQFELLQDGSQVNQGEVFLSATSIGLSQKLLNFDHDDVYFKGAPIIPDGEQLRRHGDELIRFPNGYYQACGRTDDAMNLGGIKVSAVEIEKCLNSLPQVSECAAVAISNSGSGPARLVVFAVLNEGDENLPDLQAAMQEVLSKTINPLFRIDRLIDIETLPRTASQKIIRRRLRSMIV